MKKYRITFGFMRGRRGDIVEVSDEHAASLLEAGLIEPVKAGTAEARETATVTPESKEGGHAAKPSRSGRQSRETKGG